jgi:hypothetical protein
VDATHLTIVRVMLIALKRGEGGLNLWHSFAIAHSGSKIPMNGQLSKSEHIAKIKHLTPLPTSFLQNPKIIVCVEFRVAALGRRFALDILAALPGVTAQAFI